MGLPEVLYEPVNIDVVKGAHLLVGEEIRRGLDVSFIVGYAARGNGFSVEEILGQARNGA